MPNGVVTEYGYDNASQLTAITYKKGAATLGNLTYGYDQIGKRNQMGGSLARTQIPPTLSLAHTYNALNQLKQRGATTLVYDNEGNLTNDGTTAYTWNARGELTGMTRTGLTASFAYDAFGRRISKTINGATTKFLYDGADAVQEQNASGAPTANLLVGGTDTVLSRSEGATTRTFQHDGLGSAIGLLDQNGATTTSYAYEPFGATTQSGGASNNASKYTGREDDGTGLYYYRARYYSPTLQRFISEDPIGFAGGDVNLYGYVGNDPVSYADPSGLQRYGGSFDLCSAGNNLSGRKDRIGDPLMYGGFNPRYHPLSWRNPWNTQRPSWSPPPPRYAPPRLPSLPQPIDPADLRTSRGEPFQPPTPRLDPESATPQNASWGVRIGLVAARIAQIFAGGCTLPIYSPIAVEAQFDRQRRELEVTEL